MSDWRFLRSWSKSEIKNEIALAKKLGWNFSISDVSRTKGWTHFTSQKPIAREVSGRAVSGGAFERAVNGFKRIEYSDPRIVRAHYEFDSPLLNRDMLLEIKVLGLHYLCPVRIGAIRDETHASETIYGFRYDTLSGHLESGSQWLLLRKNHATGDVFMQVKAVWRAGDFPNWWSQVGFVLLVTKYQRVWRHLAYTRMRSLTLGHTPQITARVIALGAVSGMRSVSGMAFAASNLSMNKSSKLLWPLALAEMLADKSSRMPDRTASISLFGRATAGAVAGLSLAKRMQAQKLETFAYGGIAALTAVGVAYGMSQFRRWSERKTGFANATLGLIEDSLALLLGNASEIP